MTKKRLAANYTTMYLWKTYTGRWFSIKEKTGKVTASTFAELWANKRLRHMRNAPWAYT